MGNDKLDTEPFDASEYLDSEKRIRLFLEEAFDTGDPAFIVKCFGIVAKARNMSKLAKETGMSRPALYKALSGEGRPEFGTILKVARALGLDLTVKPHMSDAA
jgi:probable addiction module antidote protein